MDKLIAAFAAFFEEWLTFSDTGKGNLEEIIDELRRLPAARATRPRVPAVVERWLEPALAADSAPHCQAVMTSLGAAFRHLNWQTVPDEFGGATFAPDYGFVQLIGRPIFGNDPSPFASDRVAGGFSLQAPGAFYPPHQQSSAEFYGILSGIAEWQIYYNRPMFHPPGAHIFHPAESPHAMETTAEPLLLIWAWYGDLATPQRIHSPSGRWL